MSNMRNKSIRPAPSEIEYKGMRFLITDRPTETTLASYVEVRAPGLGMWGLAERQTTLASYVEVRAPGLGMWGLAERQTTLASCVEVRAPGLGMWGVAKVAR